MIGELFLTVFGMSVSATIVAVFTLLAGALLRRLRAPQAVTFLLWAVVLFRFLCPVTFTSGFSPLGIPVLRGYVQRFERAADGHTGDFKVAVDVPGGSAEFDRVTAAGIEPRTTEFGFDAAYYEEAADGSILPAKTSRETQLPVLGAVWLCGAAAMALYGAFSYLRLRGQLRFAVRTGEAGVWESDRIATPCVAGFLRPRIYLTFGLDEQRRRHILCHERAHIRHGDHLWKLAAFAALCVHWFNPWCWMLFRTFQEDLEIACDERVLRRLGAEAKEDYSESLLALSAKPRFLAACPLAFGENATKARVRQILRFRKPVLWAAIPTAAVAAVLALALLSNPAGGGALFASTYRVTEMMYDAPEYSMTYTPETMPEFRISEDLALSKKEVGRDWGWEPCGVLTKQRPMNQERFAALFSGQPAPEGLLGQNREIYRANAPNDPNHTFFLLLHQRDGTLLLGVGYDHAEGARLRWLFALEAVSGNEWQAKLYQNRTAYIGDNAKVGGILSSLDFPKELVYDGFELFTGSPPYSLAVHFKTDPTTRAACESGQVFENILLKNAALLFSLIENADSAAFVLDDGVQEPAAIHITRDRAERIIRADLWRESSTLEGFALLCRRIDLRVEQAALPATETQEP